MPSTYSLSKTKLNAFRQCDRRLWLEVHKPDLAQASDSTHATFATGHEVGALAQAEYPRGLLISPDNNLHDALAQTAAALGRRKPMFEATFKHDGLLIRADLMLPVAKGWHMVEVKSSGSAKAYHIHDVATQVWVAQADGAEIHKASIRHINTEFVLRRNGDYDGLLIDDDVSDQVALNLPLIPETLALARATLQSIEPSTLPGEHCTTPFDCPFQAHCGNGIAKPPKYPVSLLPGSDGKALAQRLLEEGHQDLRKVPTARFTKPLFQRIHAATKTGKPFRDAVAAQTETSSWTWPRYFLDFETIGFAVPKWVGTHPFEQVPFQFSCHVQKRSGAISHSGFLDLSGNDPARACAEALVAALGKRGSIITYNAGFERGCIRRLAAAFADLRPALTQIESRIVDLLPVVRKSWYHRDMLGSYSIKAVLPTMVPDLRYDALDGVRNGGDAQLSYLAATQANTSTERKGAIQRELEAYCSLDTLAMVKMMQELF